MKVEEALKILEETSRFLEENNGDQIFNQRFKEAVLTIKKALAKPDDIKMRREP